MTTIGVIIGIIIFLLLGYISLMFLVIPYLWFRAYLEQEEIKANKSRERFQRKREELARDGKSVDWISPYKDDNKRGIRRFTDNELVEASAEWLLTWGVFLVIEGFWAYGLYNGLEFIMTNVGEVLENWFYNE